MQKKHILVIDDDKRIRELLKKFLDKNDFFITTSSNTKEARQELLNFVFDLIVVDLMMPEETGVEFLTKIRKNGNIIPAIVLTAMGDIDTKIECFENGCNDYLVKPFEPRELILRINNILKEKHIENNFCEFGDYIFDFNKQILLKNNNIVSLTDIETKILNKLCLNLNSTLSREELLFDDLNERSIDVAIARLRKKIEENVKNSKYLRTIRNKGYILNN